MVIPFISQSNRSCVMFMASCLGDCRKLRKARFQKKTRRLRVGRENALFLIFVKLLKFSTFYR